MEKVKDFEDLLVWKKAHNLVLNIYTITKNFPPEEKFGLVSQMRRAAVSVPANISEGFNKRSVKDKSNFYNISQGSLNELKYYIILSKDLNYMKEVNSLLDNVNEIGKMLNGLIKSITGRT